MKIDSRKSPNILVVDDDKNLLSLVADYLELRDYPVMTASTGLEALQLLRSGAYDVLITDIVISDISGLGLIEIARREKPDLIIIAMTGYGNKVGELTTEKAPDYYLEKPFELEELSRILETC